jgi:hypothetical protein
MYVENKPTLRLPFLTTNHPAKGIAIKAPREDASKTMAIIPLSKP